MTTASNRFTTKSPLFIIEQQEPLPAGLTIIALKRPGTEDGYAEIIYASSETPEYHRTCHVTNAVYNMLRHEQNRQ